ncbi:histidinol-phosphate transaminase [Sedimentibacter hydroxybenzoicus DSM 7310]|uniref:Histidinol-phosphate aminotransferase n=1 Tax=Sedimentibacter hydroxybenzoicus DSM 7310 TaxID=1123245 RepID=A0A974GY14_SEDHY|nr:histidinol-phosphate transaminase [Sedimentibacter hydroxybenzoicus]NYB75640.1 histidinol-phosphate transaminase [Sedimentibacter hydroxybenzoicus DSM 7310]
MIKLKPSVERLQAYFVNDIPYRVKLDANEGSNYLLTEGFKMESFSPNLYPDSDSVVLRKKMAAYYGCSPDNIMVGNGSSEMINMVINAYCEKDDRVMSFVPSFSMYQTYCDLCGAEYVGIETENDFSQNMDKLIKAVKEQKPKVVIVCTPNNPTGFVTPREDIIGLLESTEDSLVILDEAYIDFSEGSTIELINTYENLVVMRTLSKAFGLAGLRVGALIAKEETVRYIWKVKVPYNINVLSQYAAEQALENKDRVNAYISSVKSLRSELAENLEILGFKIYPSGANFLFVQSPVDNLYEKLMEKGVLIRKISYKGVAYNRITVGTKEENEILINEIKKINGEDI